MDEDKRRTREAADDAIFQLEALEWWGREMRRLEGCPELLWRAVEHVEFLRRPV